MARPGVTYTEVAEAATQLLGQGKKPTIEQIRHQLGSGSSSTLAPHLRKWKEAYNNEQGLISKVKLPQELHALIQGLWERLFEKAEERISSIETSYQKENQELSRELKKYKHNNQRWQILYNQWIEDKKQLIRTNSAAEKIIQELQQEYATLSEKQKAQLEQIQEKQDRIKELHRLHQQVQDNLVQFRESTRTQRLIEQQRNEKEKSEFELRLKKLKKNDKQLRMEFSKMEKERQTLKRSEQTLKEKNDELKSQIEIARIKIKELEKLCISHEQKAENFRSLYQDGKVKIETQTKQLIDLKTESGLLAIQLSEIKKKLEEALKRNKQFEIKKNVVGQKIEQGAYR